MRERHLLLGAVMVGITILLATGIALAQSGGGYDLTWSTVDGGGGTSSGGGYELSGTAGQWDAGGMSGGGYTLQGGFWAGTSGAPYRVYLPLVLREFSAP